MTSSGAELSVIIPTHYRDQVLKDAIESCLDSDFDDLEVIIVDDSGERYAKEVVDGYPVKYIAHSDNQGGNPARNTGIEHATGEFVQLLDDDDQVKPDKFEKQIQHLKSNDESRVVFCGVENSDGTVELPNFEVHTDFLRKVLAHEWWPCSNSTMMIERDAIEAVTPLAKRKCNDDVGFMIELSKRFDFSAIEEPLLEKNDAGSHRFEKEGCIDIRRSILFDEYGHLYEKYPDSVYDSAKQTISRSYVGRMAEEYNDHWWSSDAIRLGLKSVKTDISIVSISGLISSFFGKVGYDAAREVHALIK